MNACTFEGRLTGDPICKATQSGKYLASFSLAVNKKVNSQQVTTYVPVTCWQEMAQAAADRLKKGTYVRVEGELNVNSYERNGEKKTFTGIVARRILLPLDTYKYKQGTGDFGQYGQPKKDDDIPF